MRLARVFIEPALCFALPIIILGCEGKAANTATGVSAKTLTAATQSTYARHLKAHKAGEIPPGQEIPRSCWAKEIRALHPVRVYLHRFNVVVVQTASADTEEGKYISMLISSYAPQSGDDGFTFSNQSGSVWDFRRSVGN